MVAASSDFSVCSSVFLIDGNASKPLPVVVSVSSGKIRSLTDIDCSVVVTPVSPSGLLV